MCGPVRGGARWPVKWEGWLPLTIAPAEGKGGKAAAAAAAGAVVGGPVGAAAAAALIMAWNKEVRACLGRLCRCSRRARPFHF